MKSESAEAYAKIVYTKKVPAPGMYYAWKWEAFTTIDEVKAAGLLMKDEEVIKFRNDQAEGKARSAAFVQAAEAAKIEKPTAENSGHIRLKDAYKNAMSCKLKDGTTPRYTEAQARELAETVTGEVWSDFETE
jgi:hypothetical protein